MEVVIVRPSLSDSLNLGPQSLQNFREDLWVDENGVVRPISSPFMLTNSLDEEVKRVRSCSLQFDRALMMAQMEAAYINLPYDEDEEESQFHPSPLTSVSDTVTTPPLSPCTTSSSPDSIGSPFHLPASPESPFLFALPLSLSGRQTISPCEIFSPLPQADDSVGDAAMEELLAPPTPVVPTQSLPKLLNACSNATLSPSPSPPQSPPIAGPSRSAPKRLRWSEDESDDESDEFTPQKRKAARPGKRLKGGSLKRGSAKLEGKGTKCDLCGKHLGRSTDLPRHKESCKENPGRAVRQTPCEICGKILPGTF